MKPDFNSIISLNFTFFRDNHIFREKLKMLETRMSPYRKLILKNFCVETFSLQSKATKLQRKHEKSPFFNLYDFINNFSRIEHILQKLKRANIVINKCTFVRFFLKEFVLRNHIHLFRLIYRYRLYKETTDFVHFK